MPSRPSSHVCSAAGEAPETEDTDPNEALLKFLNSTLSAQGSRSSNSTAVAADYEEDATAVEDYPDATDEEDPSA